MIEIKKTLINGIVAASLLTFGACGENNNTNTLQAAPKSDAKPEDRTKATEKTKEAIDKGLAPSARECRRGNTPEINPEKDLRGVMTGMSWDDVRIVLGCLEDTARLVDGGAYLRTQTYGQTVRQVLHASDGRPCRSDEIPSMSRQFQNDSAGGTCRTIGMNGQTPYTEITENIRVIFTGVKGEETAQSIFRTKTYDGDSRPPVEAVMSALTSKYGEVSRIDKHRGWDRMVWLYDTRGRRMSESNPAFRNCFINGDFKERQRWNSTCGLVIGAEIIPDRENPLLVSTLHVAMMDQAGLIEGEKKMEAALKARQDAMRAEEAERAQEAASEVDL